MRIIIFHIMLSITIISLYLFYCCPEDIDRTILAAEEEISGGTVPDRVVLVFRNCGRLQPHSVADIGRIPNPLSYISETTFLGKGAQDNLSLIRNTE